MIVDQLFQAVENQGHVCVGLDTDLSYVPDELKEGYATHGESILAFNKAIIDATYDVAACYKVQVAYYEALGIEGMTAYRDTLAYIHKKKSLRICDIKRGDIQQTAAMYAKAHFEGDFEGDWVTLNAYMGVQDSLEPFLQYIQEKNKGIFVLIRTSNKGALDFQYIKDGQDRPLYEEVGRQLEALSREYIGTCGYSSIGGVVGCTNNEKGALLRNKIKHMFLLIPGYGAQGGGARDVVPYLINGNGGVVNSSRGIIQAHKSESFKHLAFDQAARMAAIKMRDEIWGALSR